MRNHLNKFIVYQTETDRCHHIQFALQRFVEQKNTLFSLVRSIVSAVHWYTRPAICKTYLLNASSLQTTNISSAQRINHLIRGNSELEEILTVLRNNNQRHHIDHNFVSKHTHLSASILRIKIKTIIYSQWQMTDFIYYFFAELYSYPNFMFLFSVNFSVLSADETDY